VKRVTCASVGARLQIVLHDGSDILCELRVRRRTGTDLQLSEDSHIFLWGREWHVGGFEGGKVAYVQFLEDSYGTAGSFKTGGKTRFHSDPSGKVMEF
jgi:hypothetical protein